MAEAVGLLLEDAGMPHLEETVDGFKWGNPEQELRGVVTTFTATADVLERAAAVGANLVITHEPTFYDHWDTPAWLETDAVCLAKMERLRSRAVAVWRLHDHWHRRHPDGIREGFLAALGWSQRWDAGSEVVRLDPVPLSALAAHIKQSLGLRGLRWAGPPEWTCRTIAPALGAVGPARQLELLRRPDVDVVVCGETVEWQVGEYVRDACLLGRPKGLLVLGHAGSEEAGMQHLADWLRPRLAPVPVVHVPAGDPFHWT